MPIKKKMRKKLGRNDPCPCGSGKKYKNCCLLKERAQSVKEQPKEIEVPNVLKKIQQDLITPESPHQRGIDPFWKEFQNKTLEEQVVLCQEEIEKGAKYEPFDMIDTIRFKAWTQNKLHLFRELLLFFQRTDVNLFQEDESYYRLWLAEVAFTTGVYDNLLMTLEYYKKYPEKDIDSFFKIIDLFSYYGQTETLIEVMTETYQQISASENIIGSGIINFFDRLVRLKVFKMLETKPAFTEKDLQELFTHLEELDEINVEEIQIIISWLLGQHSRIWKAEDFEGSIKKQERERNLYLLSLDFLRYLHVDHKVPLSKGELVRWEIASCWYEQRRLQKRKDEASILYPRSGELDRSLGRLASLFAPHPVRLACVIEYLPHLIQFLAKKGLIYNHHIEKVIKDLQTLQNSTIKYLANKPSGQGLISVIKKNW